MLLHFDEGLGQGAEVQQTRVGVNEARDDGVPIQVDDAGIRSGAGPDRAAGADGEHLPGADRDRFSDCPICIAGKDPRVVEDDCVHERPCTCSEWSGIPASAVRAAPRA
jgi:hypothetical protein